MKRMQPDTQKCSGKLLLIIMLLTLNLWIAGNTQLFAEPRGEVYLSSRGFLSAGAEIKYYAGAENSFYGGIELPILLSAAKGSLESGLVRTGYSRLFFADGLRIQINPEIRWIWHQQELGDYCSLQTMLSAGIGPGDSRKWIGIRSDLEWNPLTYFAPGGYVKSTFEGTGQEAYDGSWLFSTGFNLLIGLDGGMDFGPLEGTVVAGLRFQPGSVAPMFSGVPYGQLPFFLELGVSFP